MAQKRINPIKITKEYIRNLEPLIRVERAILFGSAAKGKRHIDSDLDIIVLSRDFAKMDFMKRLVLLSKARGRKFMSPAMDIFGYTPSEFKRGVKESVVLKEAQEEGKIFY
jgi:predicted nucleotidyltransferase